MCTNSSIFLSQLCLLALVGSIVAAPKCGNVLKTYEELGCKAVQSSNADICSASFECPDFQSMDKNVCHLKGKTYNDTQTVDDNSLLPSCETQCYCRSGKLTCAHIECPEHFRGHRQGCVSQYNSAHSCCESSNVCDHGKIAQLGECYFEGAEYRLNQKMYPKEDTCYRCLCTENFVNTTDVPNNPNCERIDCGIELYYLDRISNGCVPVYFENRCCPIDFRCPAAGDAIAKRRPQTSKSDDGAVCKFGDLSLKRGQSLKSSSKCKKCKCRMPPMLTCSQSSSC